MKQKFKNFLKKFFLINDTPHKVAGGAALGVFMGITPGEGVISTLLMASLFRLNRLASLVGVLAVNFWSTVIILPIAAYIGMLVFGVNINTLVSTYESNRYLGWKIIFSEAIIFKLALPLLVGFILVAGIISLGVYLAIYVFLKKSRDYSK